MRLTAEIRWFWPDTPPQEFHGWFVGAGAFSAVTGPTEIRVDEYLRDPDQTSLGIKKRGHGDVEIKALISRRDKNLDFAGCTSPIEHWAKWACRTLDLDNLPLIRLEKQRWQRSFSVHAGTVSELATSSNSVTRQSGCDAELTLLKGPDMALWWTLCFEAYGEMHEVEAVLSRTVSLMARRCPPPLTPGEAIGYPSPGDGEYCSLPFGRGRSARRPTRQARGWSTGPTMVPSSTP
jgi:hypothetical protein